MTFWLILTAFGLAFSASFLVYLSIEKALDHENLHIIESRMHTLETVLSKKKESLATARSRIEMEWPSVFFKIYVRLRDSQGQTVSVSPDVPSEIQNEIFPNPQSKEEAGFHKVSGTSGTKYLIGTRLESLGDRDDKLYADLAFGLSGEQVTLNQIRFWMVLIAFAAALAAAVIVRKISEISFHPVKEIAKKTARISPSNLSERIEMRDLPTELRVLVESFNALLDRLSKAFERLSQFSSDIAHELRTPVNNIRGEIEVALAKERTASEYKEVLSSCLEELQRITKITDGLLFIAKSENPETQLSKDVIPLASELNKIAEFYDIPASESAVLLTVEATEDLRIRVDRTLFQRALSNLISNAISHTKRGGMVVISAMESDDSIIVRVTDTGEGIPSEHLPKVFDRFYRVDSSRTAGPEDKPTGFGLGLPIVQGIVHLHGGRVEISSLPGMGTSVGLYFPKQ